METGKAVAEGWAEGADEEKLLAWKKAGMEFEVEMKAVLEDVYSREYWTLLRKVCPTNARYIPIVTDRILATGIKDKGRKGRQ